MYLAAVTFTVTFTALNSILLIFDSLPYVMVGHPSKVVELSFPAATGP